MDTVSQRLPMIDTTTTGLFLLAVLALFLSPGPNMAFVVTHGVAYGARGGVAAALGITAADLLLSAITAGGITAMVAAWPPAFDLLRFSGALYLIWLALQAWRAPASSASMQAQAASSGRIFARAMLNSLLNPKALLFFMVFLPQFVHAERGHVALQLALLGLILSCAALVFNCLLGFFGGQIGTALERHPGAVMAQRWLLSSVLIALAVRLLILDRPVSR